MGNDISLIKNYLVEYIDVMLPFLVQYSDLLTKTEPPDHRGNVNFA